MIPKRISSSGYLASKLQTDVADLREIAKRLRIRPRVYLNDVPHFGPRQKIREHLTRKTKRPRR